MNDPVLKCIEAIIPDWASCAEPAHCHGRRYTLKYRRKKGIVKSLWIVSGLSMLVIPILPFMAALGLFTTFLSFVILDETE